MGPLFAGRNAGNAALKGTLRGAKKRKQTALLADERMRKPEKDAVELFDKKTNVYKKESERRAAFV